MFHQQGRRRGAKGRESVTVCYINRDTQGAGNVLHRQGQGENVTVVPRERILWGGCTLTNKNNKQINIAIDEASQKNYRTRVFAGQRSVTARSIRALRYVMNTKILLQHCAFLQSSLVYTQAPRVTRSRDQCSTSHRDCSIWHPAHIPNKSRMVLSKGT